MISSIPSEQCRRCRSPYRVAGDIGRTTVPRAVTPRCARGRTLATAGIAMAECGPPRTAIVPTASRRKLLRDLVVCALKDGVPDHAQKQHRDERPPSAALPLGDGGHARGIFPEPKET